MKEIDRHFSQFTSCIPKEEIKRERYQPWASLDRKMLMVLMKKHVKIVEKKEVDEIKLYKQKHRVVPLSKLVLSKQREIGRKFTGYKIGAKKRGYNFLLSHERFEGLIKLPCFYCGKQPGNLNGVDRKDNSMGYTLENSVSCCKECNRMKGELTIEIFFNQAKNITNRLRVIDEVLK